MNPHRLMDDIDLAIHRLQQGEWAAARQILLRIQDEAEREALEMDRWGDHHAEAQDVLREYRFD